MSSMTLQPTAGSSLLFVGFNQDHKCFACGTDNGFRVYNSDPFKATFAREFSSGGIGYIEMLFRCNIVALVGGGHKPRYSPNKVVLWDDYQNRCIGELSYRNEVKAVKLRRDIIAVVLSNKVYVYALTDLKLFDHIDTGPNDRGLCALCPATNAPVLAVPSSQKGHIQIERYDKKKRTIIRAHEGDLVCFALSFDGTRIATASEKGTLIRVFDTLSGKLLQELRRGTEKAEIYSIAFNSTGQWLAVSSDRGTVHIFKLEAGASAPPTDESTNTAGATGAAGTSGSGSSSSSSNNATEEKKGEVKNTRSWFSGLGSVLNYWSSEWSFAQFKVPTVRSIVAFGSEANSIVVVCANGTYYKAVFDPTKPNSECVQESYSKFLVPASTDE